MGERLLATANPDRLDQRLQAHHALWATRAAMAETAAVLPHLEQGLRAAATLLAELGGRRPTRATPGRRPAARR